MVPVVVGAPLSAVLKLPYFCQSPVLSTWMLPSNGPVAGSPHRMSKSAPPSAGEATRIEMESMAVRLTRLKANQSSDSIYPISLVPPAESDAASILTPGSPVDVEPANRPMVSKCSAWWCLSCSTTEVVPVSAGTPPGAALVGVGRLDDPEQVDVAAVSAVSQRFDGAVAAGGLTHRMRVAVRAGHMAQQVLHLHQITGDRFAGGGPVLGVG